MTVGQLDDLLDGAETKDDGGTTKYHVAYSALGNDRGTIWQTRSQIESYLRQYNDAQVSLPKSSAAKTATTAKSKLDTTTIDQQEYKNMYKIATADTETEDHLKFRLANVDKMIKEVKDAFNGGEITTKKHLDMLQEDCTRLLSKKKAMEDGLKVIQERNKAKATAKTATTAKTDDLSSTKINLSVKDFHKKEIEDEYGDFKNAPLKLHEYSGKSVEYYDENGKKQKATPYISEFYASNKKQDKVGGYEIHFDRPMAIGVFKTLNEAINALNDWMNKMRVPGHGAPKWIHNRMKGEYQMNFSL